MFTRFNNLLVMSKKNIDFNSYNDDLVLQSNIKTSQLAFDWLRVWWICIPNIDNKLLLLITKTYFFILYNI